MKKLFALVLSLALVVAFAVPALATGWATLDTAPVYKDITINVYGLETVANTSKVGYLYAELKTPYPVVKGTLLHFLVELYIPYTKLSPATKKLMEVKGLDLEIATSNMTIIDTADYDTKIPTSSGKINTKSTAIEDEFTKTDYAVDKTWAYEVWATANSDKETKVVATAGFYNEFVSNTMEIYNAEAKKVMTVITNDVEKPEWFTVSNGTANVVFWVTGKQINKSLPVQIDYAGVRYNIAKSTVRNPDFLNTTNNTYVDDTTYKTMLAAYTEISKFLGFEYDEADYMTAAHYEKFFGTIGEVSASYTWNAGMVVVNPANPNLPQTGDNASIVGFAMVVVAMVAAAVVTFKKVRA